MGELDFDINVLGCAGVLIFEGKFYSLKRKIFHIVLFILFLLSFFFSFLENILSPFNVTKIGLACNKVIAINQSLFKYFYFIVKKDKINYLVHLIEDPYKGESDELNALDQSMRQSSGARCRRFSSIIHACSSFFYLVTLLAPLLLGLMQALSGCDGIPPNKCQPSLIYDVLWPYNIYQVPLYYLMNIWQLVATTVYMLLDSATGALACSLMLTAAERAAALSRAAPRALLAGPGGEVTPQFRAWVKYHQHYLSIMKTMNSEFGPYLLFVHVAFVINMILYSFFVIDQSGNSLSNNYSVAFFGSVKVLVHVFVYAKAGQQILDQSAKLSTTVTDVAQESRGLQGAGPARSALQVVVTRVSGGNEMSERVTGLGLFTLSLRTFNRVLSSSFSYLAIVLRMKRAM